MPIPDPYQNSPRRSGVRAIFLIVLLLALSFWLLAGCSAARPAAKGSAEREAERRGDASPPLPKADADSLLFAADAFDDSGAVAAIRHLEIYPFDSAAPDLRRKLFAWLVVSPRLQEFSSETTIIDPWMQSSAFPQKEELMMQYIFGSAALVITGRGEPEQAEQQEAGLRSLIAAYRNIVQVQFDPRDPFIDELDDMRRRGELRGYILRQNGMRGGR